MNMEMTKPFVEVERAPSVFDFGFACSIVCVAIPL